MFPVIDLARSYLSCSQLSVFLDRRHGTASISAVSAVSAGSVQAAKASAHQAAHLLPSILKIGVTLKEEEQRT